MANDSLFCREREELIDRMAEAAKNEFHQMAKKANDEISGIVSRHIRSEAQKRRFRTAKGEK